MPVRGNQQSWSTQPYTDAPVPSRLSSVRWKILDEKKIVFIVFHFIKPYFPCRILLGRSGYLITFFTIHSFYRASRIFFLFKVSTHAFSKNAKLVPRYFLANEIFNCRISWAVRFIVVTLLRVFRLPFWKLHTLYLCDDNA